MHCLASCAKLPLACPETMLVRRSSHVGMLAHCTPMHPGRQDAPTSLILTVELHHVM